jgi:hypothetical protein
MTRSVYAESVEYLLSEMEEDRLVRDNCFAVNAAQPTHAYAGLYRYEELSDTYAEPATKETEWLPAEDLKIVDGVLTAEEWLEGQDPLDQIILVREALERMVEEFEDEYARIRGRIVENLVSLCSELGIAEPPKADVEGAPVEQEPTPSREETETVLDCSSPDCQCCCCTGACKENPWLDLQAEDAEEKLLKRLPLIIVGVRKAARLEADGYLRRDDSVASRGDRSRSHSRNKRPWRLPA